MHGTPGFGGTVDIWRPLGTWRQAPRLRARFGKKAPGEPRFRIVARRNRSVKKVPSCGFPVPQRPKVFFPLAGPKVNKVKSAWGAAPAVWQQWSTPWHRGAGSRTGNRRVVGGTSREYPPGKRWYHDRRNPCAANRLPAPAARAGHGNPQLPRSESCGSPGW